MTDIVPTGKRVLVLMDEKASESAGGIIIAQGAQEDNPYGTVLRSGELAKEYGLNEGARVLVAEYAGTDIDHPDYPGRDVRLISSENILALVF